MERRTDERTARQTHGHDETSIPPLQLCCGGYNNSGTAKVKIIKNERDPPLFTGKLLIKFQNILRNNTQVIIRHRVKILFSVISSPITLEWQKWKSSKIVKNERDPPLFTCKLLMKFQNILRNNTQVIIRHRVKILFFVTSSPITLKRYIFTVILVLYLFLQIFGKWQWGDLFYSNTTR